jgi:ABC-2 type transport system permease protein
MWALLKAEAILGFAQFRRYFFNSLLSLGIMVLFFYGLFYGIALFVNAPLEGSSLSSLVLGFVVWTFTLGILHGIAQDIQTEATRGTLEQLALGNFRLETILVVRSVLTVVVSLFMALIIVFLLQAITGVRLHLNLAGLPSLFILALGLVGLSLALGALALYFKDVSMLFTIIQFGFLPYILAAKNAFAGQALLPLAPALHLAFRSFVNGEPVTGSMAVAALLNSLVLFALGLGLFRWVYGVVRRKGNLSMY